MSDETRDKDQADQGQDKKEPAAAGLTKADLERAVAEAVERERAGFKAKLKSLTGADSLEALEARRLEEQGQFKEAAERAKGEAEAARARVRELLARTAVTGAAAELRACDPSDVYALVKDRVQVGEDETVTVDGRPVKDYLAGFLKDKPYLVLPSGKAGSGSGPGGGAEPNPWRTDGWNLTEQGRITKADPAKAERLKAEAGVK